MGYVGVGTVGYPLQGAGNANGAAFYPIGTNSGLTAHGITLSQGVGAFTAIAPSATSGQALVSTGASTDPAYGTVGVAGGGTGVTGFVAYAPIIGGTTSTSGLQSVASVGTSGQILTSNGAGLAATFQTPAPAGTAWALTTVNASIVSGNGYIANKGSLLTMTLPASGAISDFFEVTNINQAVGVRIAQNANQQIRFGNVTTSVGVGGYIESTALGDSVRLTPTTAGASTVWQVVSAVGNWTYV